MLRPLLLTAALAAAPLTLHAQAPADGACTYATCALRVEPGFLGASVVRGAEGERVAGLGAGGTRPRLSELVRTSPQAAAYARAYERNARRGALMSAVGTLLLITPAFQDQRVQDYEIAAVLGGAALAVGGSVNLMRANRSLSRALWWYNGQFPR
jgi:hypothetical protein